MNRRSFVKHIFCILFLIFAMGQVWGTAYTTANDGNWNREIKAGDASRTWAYEIAALNQYPKSDENDTVTIKHTVSVPSDCTDAKAKTVTIESGGNLSCASGGTLTAGTVNVESGGTIVFSSGITASAVNVKSGGKIVLNSWPSPAPTFESGCIIEIGPNFPDGNLSDLEAAVKAVKTNGGTVAEIIVSRPITGISLDSSYDITKFTVNSTGVSLGNQDGIGSIEVTGAGNLKLTEALAKTATVKTGGTLELTKGINGTPAINMEGGNLILSGDGSTTINDTNLSNLTLDSSNPIKVTVDGPSVTLPTSLTTGIPANVIVDDRSGTVSNIAAVPAANQSRPNLVVNSTNTPYTIDAAAIKNYKTITVKADGKLTIDSGVSVTATTLVIEGDGTSAISSDYGEVIVNGTFTANEQDASSNYIGTTTVSGKLTVESGGEFDSNYAVTEEKGVIVANGFFKAGNFHNQGSFTCNDTVIHATSNGCKVINDGEMTFGNNARFLVFKLTDGDFDGTFTNNKTVTFGSSVYSEFSMGFTNAADGTVEIGASTQILLTENDVKFSNAGTLTVKTGAEINKKDSSQTGCTFENTGYLLREESTIFDYTSDANTLWIENKLAAEQDYELTSDAALILNVAGNLNLLVGDDTSIKSLNLYSRNHGESGDGTDHTFPESFKVTVKNKASKTGMLTLEKISISRTSRTAGVKGTLDLSSKVDCTSEIAVSSGTELDINADVSSKGITQNVLSSDTKIQIGQGITFTTTGNVTFPADLNSAGTDKHSLFSSKGTVVVKDGKSFQIDTTEGGDGLGNITFENGGSLKANSLTGSTLTVNTTEAANFTLNSNVTFDEVVLEGSSGNILSVDGTGDFILSGAGENSYADYVKFTAADHPAIYKSDGTTGADILARNSTGAGAGGAFPTGWINGDGYFVWQGKTDERWDVATNWLAKYTPQGTIKKISINTVTGGTDPVLDTVITTNDFVINKKSLKIKNAKLTINNSFTNDGTIEDYDASNTGKLELGSDFTDSGTTTISEIIFIGDKDHTFTNKASTQYNTVKLDSSITSAQTVTVSNAALITTLTDNTDKASVTFSGTATLGSVTTASNTKGKYTFTGDAQVMSDTTFNPEVEFKANATFKDNAAIPAVKDATFKSKVTFSKAAGTITGNNLSFEKDVAFSATNAKNKVTGNDVTFSANVSAKELTADVSKLILNTTPAVPAITFTATKLTLTGSAAEIKHVTPGETVILTGDFVSNTAVTVTAPLKITGSVTVNENKSITGNAAITVGTTLTNSGTIKSESTITVSGNCTNNSTGTISDVDASNKGKLKLGSDFTDSGTTSISEIIFIGDKDHTFTNKASTQYNKVTLDSSISSARTVTVSNAALITTFTDNTDKASVTFSGTATLGSVTTKASHTEGKYTFTGDAQVMSDTTFNPEVEFKANATFRGNAATPDVKDAAFKSKVTFSKADGTITGNEVTFSANVSAKDLTADVSKLILNTTPGNPAASPAVPAITFTATKLTLTGTETEIKHVTPGETVILTGNFVSDTAVTLTDPLKVTGSVTVNASKSITGNAAITVGTTLTNSGTIKSKSTITVSGNCTNNSTGTISDFDASYKGKLELGSDFTDSGTTSISEIIFFGDKAHTFTNKASTQYNTVKLDSSITSAKIFTVSNAALITTLTDETAKASVTFSGTATLGSVTTASHTEGKYTFTGDAQVMSVTTFNPEVEFKANATFKDNAATPAVKDATFKSKVTFSKADGTITGNNLSFEKDVAFPTTDGNNKVTGNEVTFSANVSAKDLTADVSKLILNTTPGNPAASPVVPAITFTATKLTLTGTAAEVSHKSASGVCKLDGELFTNTSVTVKNDFHVTGNVKITTGGKTFAVDTGKKIFCGKDFRAQGTDASNKLTVSGDIAITSNENWSHCFAEAVFCTVKDSTVYYWDGSDYSSAEASGTKAQIPCEQCTDGNNTKNWIFTDIAIESAKTLDDHRIELVLKDSIENVASSADVNGVITYTALDCLKGNGKNPDGTTDRNGKWKNNSSVIFYSIESVAPGTGANAGKTIVILSLPVNTTWNTDAAATSAGNSLSTDSKGVHQSNIPDIVIPRGNGGVTEEYTVSNKWGKRFDSTAFTSTADGASPVLIAVYTGQEKHTAGSTDGWDAHNFVEFVYSEEVKGVSAGDAPYTKNAEAPKITVDGIASFEKGSLDTRNFSDNVENANLNQFYAIKTHSFRWGVASKAAAGVWNGYIESIVQFSGNVSIPASCVIKDASAAENECILKTGLTVSNVKSGDPTVSNWDTIGPDFVPVRKTNDWSATINESTNFEIVGASSSGSAALDKLEFHLFDNAQTYSNTDTINWVTRNGWVSASDFSLLSTDSSTGTFAGDIFGGARPFEGTSAGRAGSAVADRTTGGIRKHTLVSAYTNGSFEFQSVDAEKNVSAVSSFDNNSSDISYGFSAIVFANPDTSITRQVSGEDTLYFGLKLPSSTTELRTTYIVTYNPSLGVITDLAGNRFAGTLDASGKKTVRSIDMTPPKLVMTVAPIGTKRLYVMFAKELELGKLNLHNNSGQISTEANALADIPKSLGLISLSTGETPATVYPLKTAGEIDIDPSVPAKLLFKNRNYTGLELTLTQEITLENISSLYLVVKNDSLIENAKDPITGIIGNISYIQDEIGNYMPVNSAHAFSDFAVNAVTPLYAYSTSDALDGEHITQSLYGDGQYAVRDFSRDQQNFGTMIPGDDYTFIVKTCSEITDENQLVMIASRNPTSGSVSKAYNETSRTDRRIWLPQSFSAISPVANTNVIESGAPSSVSDGFKFEYSTSGANPVDWASQDEITFLYEIKKDSAGNAIDICHSPVLSVTGTVDVDARSPIYALTLDNPADLLSIDLWSFKLKTPVDQRGGVTILNNVINSVYGEKTLVKVDVPQGGANVTVAVMTLDGNIVKYLVSGSVPGGSHYYEWDGTNLNGGQVARGMYFIRVFGDGFDETRKVMVVK